MAIERWLYTLPLRVRSLLRGRRVDEELDDELRFHVEQLVRQNVARGMSPVDAHAAALRAMNGVEQRKEECRDARRVAIVEDALKDLRHAARLLRRTPAFTVVALLSLALGIGATTAIFNLVDAVLLRDLPVRAPKRLVLLAERAPAGNPRFSFSTAAFNALRTSAALDGVCAFRPWPGFRVSAAGGAQLVTGQLVSGNCFSVLGLAPELGRLLTPEDDRAGSAPVAVVSHAFWRRHFGGASSAIGAGIDVQGRAMTVVGVTPREFHGLEAGRQADITVPLAAQPIVLPGTPLLLPTSGARWLRLIGRLAPGVGAAAARADLQRLWIGMEPPRIAVAGASGIEVVPGSQGLNDLRTQFAFPLRALMIGVVVLLLAACANVANLLLVRARTREHEMALRLALGAGRGRVIRQLLTEAIALAVLGGAGGVVLAYWADGAIVALLSRGRSPLLLDLAPDVRSFAFTSGLSLISGVLFGMWPALRATQPALQSALQARTRHATAAIRRRHGVLVVSQAAFSLVLLTTAGLFVRSLDNLYRTDIGARTDGVLLASIRPAVAGIEGKDATRLYQALYDRISGLRGVVSATIAMDTPLGGLSWTSRMSPAGATPGASDPDVHVNFVGPRFCETMGIPLARGRDISVADTDGAPAIAVVSASVARRLFPDRPAIGERVLLNHTTMEIVGVSGDVRYRSIREPVPLIVYRPYLQQAEGVEELTFAVRAAGDLDGLADAVRREVMAIAPGLPVYAISTLDAQRDATLATERVLATLSTVFGVTALLLVGIGVYGTVAYATASRTREFGVRMALGATPAELTTLMLRVGVVPVAAGVALGLPIACGAGWVARAALFGTTATDPGTFASAVAILLLSTLTAAAVPAFRAGRTDPARALRRE